MALSRRLRSIANFLIKPVPLASTLGVLLLGVFIWEYVRHPEWFAEYSQDETTSGQGIDLSGLTPEEQAAIADIDNLTVLFNELGIESGGIPNIQAAPAGESGEQPAQPSDLLSLSPPAASPNTTATGSPFAEYLEQYQFSARLPQLGEPGANQDLSGGVNGEANAWGSQFGQPRQFGPNTVVNPLATALQNQSLMSRGMTDNEGAAQAGEGRSPQTPESPDDAESGAAETAASNPSNFTGEFSSQIVTIPGGDLPVLPTQPQMSPPPGTTGYTPPATLELMPPLPGSRNQAGTLPPVGTSPLPAEPTGVPNLVPGRTPNLTAPQVDVSNGYTPYSPTVPATPPTAVPPAPFSAPRPPGSYTGGGYINTFSNPSGPSN